MRNEVEIRDHVKNISRGLVLFYRIAMNRDELSRSANKSFLKNLGHCCLLSQLSSFLVESEHEKCTLSPAMLVSFIEL